MISDDAKYIIFDNGLNYVPIVFANFVEHETMAKCFPPHWVPISAGFVTMLAEERLLADGESRSLNLKALPGDTKMISRMLFGKGHR